MITWMQRHKKWLVITIWISTIAFVGAGFVGWGSYDYGKQGAVVAVVGDREVSVEEYQQEYSKIYEQYAKMFGPMFSKELAEQLKLTDSYGSKGYVDKNILAVNVNKENSDSSVFKSLDKYYTDNNSSYFKGNSNISNSAGSYLSNIKSSDSLSSSVKTTSLNSATLSKISNLFI